MLWNFFDVLNNHFKDNTFEFDYSVEFPSIRSRRPRNVELIQNALDKCKHKQYYFNWITRSTMCLTNAAGLIWSYTSAYFYCSAGDIIPSVIRLGIFHVCYHWQDICAVIKNLLIMLGVPFSYLGVWFMNNVPVMYGHEIF